jgi:hypothetical protein
MIGEVNLKTIANQEVVKVTKIVLVIFSPKTIKRTEVYLLSSLKVLKTIEVVITLNHNLCSAEFESVNQK